ncbi:MAG: hypothetical protein LBU00_06920 [Treponema sp.]|nr:hypothetical protein [Treponema sp.]
MKKIALVLIVALAASGALFAQTNPTFSGSAPEFFSFDFGAGFGVAFDDAQGFGSSNETVGGVGNFGFKIEVLDNFNVGFDTLLSSVGGSGDNLFTGLRLAYNFVPQLGAAIGIGSTGTESGVSIGFFASLFQSRSPVGITTGLRLRVDFVAPFEDMGAGKIVFAPAFNIGL